MQPKGGFTTFPGKPVDKDDLLGFTMMLLSQKNAVNESFSRACRNNKTICQKKLLFCKENNYVGPAVCGVCVCTNFQCKCDLSTPTISPAVPNFPPIFPFTPFTRNILFVRFLYFFFVLVLRVIYRLTGHAGDQLERAEHPECPGRGGKGENNAEQVNDPRYKTIFS